MYRRGFVAWLLIAIAMVANGTVRELTYEPLLGSLLAHALSTLTGTAIIFAGAYLCVRGAPEASPRAWLGLGVFWTGLTIAFEFGFGHYIDGATWGELLADYDLRRGRLWSLVLVTTTISPLAAARLIRTARLGGRLSHA